MTDGVSIPPAAAVDLAIAVRSRDEQSPALSVGYSVVDLIEAQNYAWQAGGTAANVAANLAWLGLGVGIVARIGNDWAGRRFIEDMKGAGVGARHLVAHDSVETPMLIHRTGPNGTPLYAFSCPECNRRFAKYRPPSIEEAQAVKVANSAVLFVDRASAASIALMQRVREANGLVFFEPNGPGRPALTRQALALAHIVKVSADRAPSLSTLLLAVSREAVVITTRGSDGLSFRVGAGLEHKRRAPRTAVVDAAGAGDWLTSGLLARLMFDSSLSHRNLEIGLRTGQWLAAQSCGFFGARGLNRATSFESLVHHNEIRSAVAVGSPIVAPPRRQSARDCSTCRRDYES